MRITFALVLSAACTILALRAGWSAEMNMAVVDMSRLINAHPNTESNDSIIEGQLDDFESERREMLAELKKLNKEVELAHEQARNRALSDKVRDSKMDTAAEKLLALRKCEQKIRERANLRRRQISDQRVRMRRQIVSELREIIREYVEKQGLVLVLDSSGIGMNAVESVVYSLERIDISDDILKMLRGVKQDREDGSVDDSD